MTGRTMTAPAMMPPRHHPSDVLLVGYGAGSLCEGMSLAVALHLSGCPACRAGLETVEALGGVLLEELSPAPLERVTLAGTLARLDGAAGGGSREESRSGRPVPTAKPGPPAPLRPYLDSLAAAPWRRLAPGVQRLGLLPRGSGGGCTQLLRVAPGTALPHHGHDGLEVTAVLAGAFSDEWGRYRYGDLVERDEETRHRPVADSRQGCLCLIATDAPLRFTGWMGRLIQPFTGF